MDIRWKNTADKAKAFLKENISSVTGTAAFILGLIMLVFLSDKVKYYVSSKETWGFGIIMNVFMGIAVYLILSDVLKNIYRDWLPENSDFYSSWKNVWKKQQRILWTAGGALFFIAMFFLISQMTYSRYYYSNFAFGYLLVATAVLQFGIAKLTVTRFMNRRLDLLMDSVNEINKERLCEAIEIEKNSIEKAAKSEQLKVDLISNVSHDLKTPLTSMVGYLELLKKEELDDVSKDYVNVISDKAQKLKEMIESLFSLAKASSGNMQFNMESIELNRLIEQIFADMDDKIRDSDLKFVNMLTEEDTHMITDNIHMYRICQNLIENALKYSAGGTRVFVRTFIEKHAVEDLICLQITNTSGYLMDFSKEDIVERFARGDKSRSGDGNGLGLAIVSTYTAALGGSFDINIDCDQFKAILHFPLYGEKNKA